MKIENDEIIAVIANSLKIQKHQVIPDLQYHDIPSWDSLGHVYLISELERAFNIQISNDLVYKLRSVLDICNFIQDSKQFSAVSGLPKNEVFRGLNNVYFDETSISFIDSEQSKISYREYDLHYLLDNRTFEEIVYLLIYEHLPSEHELKAFLLEFFLLQEDTFTYFSTLYTPVDSSQYISILEFLLYLKKKIQNRDQIEAYHIYGATLYFISLINGYQSQKDITVDHLLKNTFFIQDKDLIILKKCMVLMMEHGANAGSFSLRVSVSTGNDFISSVCTAIITFSGHKHGGAMIGVHDFVCNLMNRPNIEWFLEMCIQNNVHLPGFGHRVYKKEDPRVTYMAKLIDDFSLQNRCPDYYNTCIKILKILEKYKSYGLIPNVDFFSNIILNSLKIHPDKLLTIFIVSRMPGWIAHYKEQRKNNILIRPLLKYNGKPIISE